MYKLSNSQTPKIIRSNAYSLPYNLQLEAIQGQTSEVTSNA